MKSILKHSIVLSALFVFLLHPPITSAQNSAVDSRLNVPLPGLEDVKVGVNNGPQNTNQSPNLEGIKKYLNAIYRYGLGLGALLAILRIAYAAIKYSTSGGNSSSQTEAVEIIKNALWGLGLLLVATLILNVINPRVFTLESGNGASNGGSTGNTSGNSNNPPAPIQPPPPTPPSEPLIPNGQGGAGPNNTTPIIVSLSPAGPNGFTPGSPATLNFSDNTENEAGFMLLELDPNRSSYPTTQLQPGQQGPLAPPEGTTAISVFPPNSDGGLYLVNFAMPAPTFGNQSVRKFAVIAIGPDNSLSPISPDQIYTLPK